jgi:hypothetical protein
MSDTLIQTEHEMPPAFPPPPPPAAPEHHDDHDHHHNHTLWAVLGTLVVVAVGFGIFTLTKTNESSQTAVIIHNAANSCSATRYLKGDAIIINTGDYYEGMDELDCVATTLMSPATYGVLWQTTYDQGIQTISENDMTFMFSYNGIEETAYLSVQPEK